MALPVLRSRFHIDAATLPNHACISHANRYECVPIFRKKRDCV